MHYKNKQFEAPYYTSQPLLGMVYEALPRTMNRTDVINHMCEAGYTDSFSAVSFHKPLTFPLPEEALHAFSLPGRFVLIGAVTGTVSEEAPHGQPALLEP